MNIQKPIDSAVGFELRGLELREPPFQSDGGRCQATALQGLGVLRLDTALRCIGIAILIIQKPIDSTVEFEHLGSQFEIEEAAHIRRGYFRFTRARKSHRAVGGSVTFDWRP